MESQEAFTLFGIDKNEGRVKEEENVKEISQITTIAIIGDCCSGKETVVKTFLKLGFNLIKNNLYNNVEDDYEEVNIWAKLRRLKYPNAKIPDLKTKIKNSEKKFNLIAPDFTWEDYNLLKNQTSFRLINIVTPTHKRFENFKKKYPMAKDSVFFSMDEEKYKNEPQFEKLKSEAFINIVNDRSLEDLEEKTLKVIKIIGTFFRPTWDDYFMSVAHILADRSNCIKQKVGAVLVKNNRILATGYNGTPIKIKNCYDGGCMRCNDMSIRQGRALDTCFCLHAEENCILEVGRAGCIDATIYTTVYPCLLCSKVMVESGISQVVYDKEYLSPLSEIILDAAKVKVIKWERSFDKYV